MQEVVRKSISGENIPQITKRVDGRRLVKWYDWKSYFCTLYKTIPNITTYHHFRFDKKSPGIVFVQTLADSPEIAVTISSENTIDIHKLPREIIPKGLDLKRQWYLYEEISPFCSSSETVSHVPTLHNQNQIQHLILIFSQTLWPVDPQKSVQGWNTSELVVTVTKKDIRKQKKERSLVHSYCRLSWHMTIVLYPL